MRIKRRLALGLVVALGGLGVGSGVAHAGESVAGSGSTFIKNLFEACIPDYNDTNSGGDTISYSGGGSGTGRSNYKAGTSAFAGSDSAWATADEPADFTYVPLIAGPIAIAYKHSGFNGTLKLKPATLAKIFSGAITNWSDADITADNGSAVAAKPIIVVYRSDSSGTSEGFTKYLNAAAPTIWTKAGSSTFTSSAPSGAPGGSQGKSGSDGVTNYVASTDGSITYVELSYAKEAAADGVKSISVYNGAGAYVAPSSVSAAAAVATIPDANINKTTGFITPDWTSTSAGAYPITIFSFGIAGTKYSKTNAAVANYFSYVLNTCSKAQASTLGYASLTGATFTFAKQRLALVGATGAPVATTSTTSTSTTSTTSTTVAPSLRATVNVKKTITLATVAAAAGLPTAGSSMKIWTNPKNCLVTKATVKGLKKGTCGVAVSSGTGFRIVTVTVN